MRYDMNNIALVVINMQEKYFPIIDENIELEDKINRLIRGFDTLNLPIIVTEQSKNILGPTISSIRVSLDDNYSPIEKASFSCFGCSDFGPKLKSLNKSQLVLIGIESHISVTQTALDGIDKGYKVVIPEDCIGSRSLNDKKFAKERMREYGASITTYESLLMELIKASDHENFKEISKIIK